MIVAGLIGGIRRLQRNTELADVVFIALELALEIGVLAALRILLAVPLHGREDLVLREPRLGGEQGENEAEKPLFDRHSGGHG